MSAISVVVAALTGGPSPRAGSAGHDPTSACPTGRGDSPSGARSPAGWGPSSRRCSSHTQPSASATSRLLTDPERHRRGRGPDLSSNGRWQFWGEAVNAFESEPLRGGGRRRFRGLVGAFTGTFRLFVRNPHSLPLQDAVDFGIPGLALFLGFGSAALAVGCQRVLAARHAGDADVHVGRVLICAASAVPSFDWTWEIPVVFGPAVVCAALLLSSAPSNRKLRARRLLGRPCHRSGVRLRSVCRRGDRGAQRAGSEAEPPGGSGDGRHRRCDRSNAKAARSIVPWSAEPYTQLALLEEERGDSLRRPCTS